MSRPSVARMYDYYLGGSHNFESDRALAREVLSVFPEVTTVARDNREFLRRVVLHLSALGIDQFLDLGSGIPTVGNVHEIAQNANAQARVVYVDHDPVAVTHSRELLADNQQATVIFGDLREPRHVLNAGTMQGHLDLARPLGVLMVSVLHFIADADQPAELVAHYMGATSPGSYLAISHARTGGPPEVNGAAAVYNQTSSLNPMSIRSRDDIAALFGDLTIVDPGLVFIPRWRPEQGDDLDRAVADDYPGLAGIGRRD